MTDDQALEVLQGQPEDMGKNGFVFVRDDGQVVNFAPFEDERFDVEPLGHELLLEVATCSKEHYPVSIRNASVVGTALPDLPSNTRLRVNASMKIDGRLATYGLVPGGWLPLPWSFKREAFLDRNIVLSLERHAREQARKKTGHNGSGNWNDMASADQDLDRLASLLGADVEMVNPMLAALEGNRKPPSNLETSR